MSYSMKDPNENENFTPDSQGDGEPKNPNYGVYEEKKLDDFSDLAEEPIVVKSVDKNLNKGGHNGDLYDALFGRIGQNIPFQLIIIVGILVMAVLFTLFYYSTRKVGTKGYESPEACIELYVEAINDYDVVKYWELFPDVIHNTAMLTYSDAELAMKENRVMKYHISDYKITDKKVLNETQMKHIEIEMKQYGKKNVDVTEAYMVSFTEAFTGNILGLDVSDKSDMVFTVVKIKNKGYYIYGMHDYDW